MAAGDDRIPRAPPDVVRADVEGWAERGRHAARLALIALAVVGAVEIAVLIHRLDDAQALHVLARDPLSVSADRVMAIDDRSEPLFWASAAAQLAFMIAFLSWLHRAVGVAQRLLAGRGLDVGPWGAVGSFFVPFTNVYRPYQVVHALARASDPHAVDDPDEERDPVPAPGYREPALGEPSPRPRFLAPPLGLWWATWIFSGVVGFFGAKFTSDDLSSLEHVAWVIVAAQLLTVGAAILVGLVVIRIAALQGELLRRVAVTTPPTRSGDG